MSLSTVSTYLIFLIGLDYEYIIPGIYIYNYIEATLYYFEYIYIYIYMDSAVQYSAKSINGVQPIKRKDMLEKRGVILHLKHHH